MRRVGFAIALAATIGWGEPYFAPGLVYGPGDTLLLLGLAAIAARPFLALTLNTIVPYAAGFGATVVFFEMLTGQLSVAGGWLSAVVLAAARDHQPRRDLSARVLVLAALIGFGLGALATTLIKQILAFALVEPDADVQFLTQLHQYMRVHPPDGGWPGILVPFGALARASDILVYGHKTVGYLLISAMMLTCVAAAVRGMAFAPWRVRL
jgi:hypothetical protein